MPEILLIDDDTILTRHYHDALRAQGFGVEIAETISEALALSISDFDLVVCDLMMKDEGRFQEQGTKEGLLTGLRYVETIRENGTTVPCVILTNLNLQPVLEDLRLAAETLEDVVVIRKADFDPVEFSRIAIYLVKREEIPSLSPTLGKRFAESLILQPNFGGLGIDFKKLFGYREK